MRLAGPWDKIEHERCDMSSEQILKEAMALSLEERADLVDKLLATLDPVDRGEIDRAWAEEAERRIDACDAGEMEVEPVEDVIAALKGRKR
jgi:putative addiction module component (TIGR02574 family)